MRFRLLALALPVLGLGAPAHALTTIELAGTVTSKTGPAGSYYSGVAIGDAVSFTITFDETAPDTAVSTNFGSFTSLNPAVGIVGTIDGLPVSSGPALASSRMTWETARQQNPNSLVVTVGGSVFIGPPPYATPAAAGSGTVSSSWQFRTTWGAGALANDSTATALAALAIGQTVTLQYFAADSFNEFGSPQTNETIFATLVVTPEPSTAVLVALGLAGLAIGGRRSVA